MSTPYPKTNFPAFPSGNALPPDQALQLKSTYDRLANDFALRPYADVHPVKAALSGFLSGGLQGALGAGAYSRAYRRQQQDKDIAGFNDAYANALKNQENIDKDNSPRNYTEGWQNNIDALRNAGLIGNETPDLYSRSLPPMDRGIPFNQTDNSQWQQNRPPYMEPAQTDALVKSIAGRSDIQALANNLPGFTQMGLNVTNRPSGKSGELQGSVGSYEPGLPPVIVDPGALQTNLAAAYQTGLGQGTERYKFDQEAPKRLAEVQKLLLEGKTEQAKALLTGAQIQTEKGKPALTQSQIRKNNADAKYTNERSRSSGSGAGNNPLVNLGRTQEILQRQKQAIISQMLQNGFINKKTGLITPPTAEDEWGGVGPWGWGAHGSNEAKVNQYNALQNQLNSIDSQLTGGFSSSAPKPSAPKPPGQKPPGQKGGGGTHTLSTGRPFKP